MPAVENLLRAIRAGQARAVGALVAAVPSLEPGFIAIGRAVTGWSRRAGTLYWFAETDLVRRLRRSGNRFRPMSIAGVTVLVDITDGSARLHYFHGEPYEPALVTTLQRLVKPGDVFIDVGANIGFFTVLAARLAGPGGRVCAFEPHPGAQKTLRAAIAANGLTNVDVVEAAVGARDADATPLFIAEDSVLSSTDPSRAPLRHDFPFTGSLQVPLVALDTWMRGRDDLARRIVAIKIDVEGSEAEVLAGMSRTLDALPTAAVICETDAGGPADAWLRLRGYMPTPLDLRPPALGNYLYTR